MFLPSPDPSLVTLTRTVAIEDEVIGKFHLSCKFPSNFSLRKLWGHQGMVWIWSFSKIRNPNIEGNKSVEKV